jgi:DnaK suppressor protein
VTAADPDADIAARLSAERAATQAQIAALTADRADVASTRDLVATDDEHDPEGATIAFEHARLGALLDQARDHLAAVEHAEERLRAGLLDRCEVCGATIDPQRREARPTAATCVGCAGRRR